MQILITGSHASNTRVWQFSVWSIGGWALAMIVPLMGLSVLVYHALVLKAAQEQWPIISDAVRFVERQEMAQRDRFMRQNLDAMAVKVGDMQARMLHMETVNQRLAVMAGIKPEELRKMDAASAPAAPRAPGQGQGGPLPSLRSKPDIPNVDAMNLFMQQLEQQGDRNADVLTLIESRLFEKRLEALMVPSSPPVNGPVGSGFGFRADPFTGRPALHTGLDYPGEVGTPILAAAGGMVLSADVHPQYGNLVEIDHGNGLVTRYAHASAMLVRQGDLVKRGQVIAKVGNTGRSTGPHLHFEVLVDGVQQNPAKFLASGQATPATVAVNTANTVNATNAPVNTAPAGPLRAPQAPAPAPAKPPQPVVR